VGTARKSAPLPTLQVIPIRSESGVPQKQASNFQNGCLLRRQQFIATSARGLQSTLCHLQLGEVLHGYKIKAV